jgi:hypothetical protein
MGDRDRARRLEQDRHAVGDQHRDRQSGGVGDQRVRLRRRARPVHHGDVRPVHLAHVTHLHAEAFDQAGPVGRHRRGVVAHVVGEVQPRVPGAADAPAVAGGDQDGHPHPLT